MARTRLSGFRVESFTSGLPCLFVLPRMRLNKRMGTLMIKAMHAPTINGENVANEDNSQPLMAATWFTHSTSATVKAARKIKKRFVSWESCMVASWELI